METDTNPTEAASSEEEEKIYNIGEAAQLKDWEITVASMQIVPTVSADYGEFRPDEEGNQYAQIAATVSNKGKQTDKFLPSFGFGDDVSVKLLFGDGYEFMLQIASDEKANLNIVDNGNFYLAKNSQTGEWRLYCDFY